MVQRRLELPAPRVVVVTSAVSVGSGEFGFAAVISGACGASMIGEKSPFCLLSLRHLEGRSGLRATADARVSMARGARGVHDAGVRVESLWRRSAECRLAIRGGVANWRSRGDRLTPERASRAPRPRTPGHRPQRLPESSASDALVPATKAAARGCGHGAATGVSSRMESSNGQERIARRLP